MEKELDKKAKNEMVFPLQNDPKINAVYDDKNNYITTIYNLGYKKEIVKRLNNYDELLSFVKGLYNHTDDGELSESCEILLGKLNEL
jgi:hypothetical protein